MAGRGWLAEQVAEVVGGGLGLGDGAGGVAGHAAVAFQSRALSSCEQAGLAVEPPRVSAHIGLTAAATGQLLDNTDQWRTEITTVFDSGGSLRGQVNKSQRIR